MFKMPIIFSFCKLNNAGKELNDKSVKICEFYEFSLLFIFESVKAKTVRIFRKCNDTRHFKF